MSAIVEDLFVYPFKSARGIRVTAAELQRRGFRHDRQWMAVDPSGMFLSQRSAPRLCLMETSLEGETVILEAPGMAPLTLSPAEESPTGMEVEVWGDRMAARVAPVGASTWMSRFLERECLVVAMPKRAVRPVDPKYRESELDEVSFADSFPLLVTSTASLDDLNRRLDTPLPMNRFRPNVVITGAGPWEEDGWAKLDVGGARLRAAKPCLRCVITTIDQNTGESGLEPLRTLSTFRRDERGVLFGVNLIPEREGLIQVGDDLRVET